MLDQAQWRPIRILNLVSVKQRLRARKGWLWAVRHRVDRLEAEYRQFLYLVAANPGATVVPWSEPLDDFWHEHILDTRQYEADCRLVAGRMIHHNPHLTRGSRPQVAAFHDTKSLYRAAFGDHDRRRPRADASSGCGTDFPMVFGDDSSGHGHSGDGSGGHGDSGASCGSSCGASCGSSCGGGGCGGGGD